MNANYSRVVNRVNRLTANLENAEYDLEYLKTIRREVSKAQYNRRVAQLKNKINNLEVESVTKLISKPLKERLKWDATRLNFMKKTSRARLPL